LHPLSIGAKKQSTINGAGFLICATYSANISNETGGTDPVNGLRAQLAFTMNTLSTLFITFTGLIEKELTAEHILLSILHLKIPDLCTGSR